MRSFILACLLLLPVAALAAPAKTTPMPAFIVVACAEVPNRNPFVAGATRHISLDNILNFQDSGFPVGRTLIQTAKPDSCEINMPLEDFKAALKARGVVIYENPFYLP